MEKTQFETSIRGKHLLHHNHAFCHGLITFPSRALAGNTALLPSDVKNAASFHKCCPLIDVWRETVLLSARYHVTMNRPMNARVVLRKKYIANPDV